MVGRPSPGQLYTVAYRLSLGRYSPTRARSTPTGWPRTWTPALRIDGLLRAHGQLHKLKATIIGCRTIVDSTIVHPIVVQHHVKRSITRSYVQFLLVSLRASLWLPCSRKQRSILENGSPSSRYSKVCVLLYRQSLLPLSVSLDAVHAQETLCWKHVHRCGN